jgi:transcriptional regulator with PAS, ATPase and Fis domain
MNLQAIKQRYGIIGSSPALDRAIYVAVSVATTDLSVLITGESGSGKEVMGKIIHENSPRKHGPFIAVNCGAIPEGTIDSELFGHEKGSFTGAHEARKGYFEAANGGTIFLDEVGELPLSTQVRLLRVLETGEFIRVGSNKAQKTSVRVVAATNVNMWQAVKRGKFRDDLYYRLNAIPITVPPLRERAADIMLLFRKFAVDSAERYRIKDPISLTNDAQHLLMSYRWPGNVRQLRNIVEQMNVIEEQQRVVNAEHLRQYLPDVDEPLLPAVVPQTSMPVEREFMMSVIAQLQHEIQQLNERLNGQPAIAPAPRPVAPAYAEPVLIPGAAPIPGTVTLLPRGQEHPTDEVTHEVVEESLSLEEKEKELISKALIKHRGRRKGAAHELGISERTLYRKIKDYGIK